MSLIVVPLPAGIDEEEELRSGLVEFTRMLELDTRRGPGAGRPPTPSVVPYQTAGWDDETIEGLDRRSILVDEFDEQTPGLAGRLERAILGALDHIALQGHATEATTAEPVALIVPVLILSPMRRTGDREPGLKALEQLPLILNAIVRELQATGLGRSRMAKARFRFLPWIFSARSLLPMPESFFRGPELLVSRNATPIVYSALASHLRSWEGYGRTRLMTDLLALNALSASADEFKAYFGDPQTQSADSRRCFYAHSGLFEYPLDDLLRESVFRQLGSVDSGRQEMIPEVAGLGEIEEAAAEEVERSAASHCNQIESIVMRDEVEESIFHFTAGEGGGSRIAQVLDFRRTIPDVERLRNISLERRADGLHTEFFRELSQCSEVALETEMHRALERAESGIGTATGELEGALRASFKSSDEVDPQSPGGKETVAASVRWVDALIQGVTGGLEELSQRIDKEQPEKPETVIEDARNLRAGWNEMEERLWKEAGRLPSTPTIFLGSLAAALAVALTFEGLIALRVLAPFSEPVEAIVVPLFALAAGWFVAYRQRQKIAEFSRRGEELSSQLGRSANACGTRLARIANLRIRQVKYAATADLRRALIAVRQRFRTELAGLRRLVVDEVAERSQRHQLFRRQEEQQPAHTLGRFRVRVESSGRIIQIDRRTFETDVADLLKRTLSLRQMPERIPLDEHREILDHQARRALDRAPEAIERFREAARELLVRAVRYGTDASQLPSLAEGFEDSSPIRLLLSGRLVRERLDLEELVQASSLRTATPWVERNLPDEVAVAMTLQPVEIRDGVGS